MDKTAINSFDLILKDRFTHSSSYIVYDTISTLWHMDKEGEELVSKIAAKVVIGLFCIEYLSHLNDAIKEKTGIKNTVTAGDITDNDIIDDIKKRLKMSGDMEKRIKDIMASLIDALESAEIKNLDELTRIAHAGDYLLSSLEDMKGAGKDDYNLWLYSIPHYYKKDLQETIGPKKTQQKNKRCAVSPKKINSKKSFEI